MLRDNDLRQRVDAIAAPTLILHGERDVLVRPGAAQWLERALPHARLVVFARCGHAPFLCEPVRFVREVADFLEHGEAP
jgi:pimeloyl-[acyl-carrier protein] methyl ester esterase